MMWSRLISLFGLLMRWLWMCLCLGLLLIFVCGCFLVCSDLLSLLIVCRCCRLRFCVGVVFV